MHKITVYRYTFYHSCKVLEKGEKEPCTTAEISVHMFKSDWMIVTVIQWHIFLCTRELLTLCNLDADKTGKSCYQTTELYDLWDLSFGFKGTVHPKIQSPLTCSAIYQSRLFWCELPGVGLNGALNVVLTAPKMSLSRKSWPCFTKSSTDLVVRHFM